jgi:hypothetical protein
MGAGPAGMEGGAASGGGMAVRQAVRPVALELLLASAGCGGVGAAHQASDRAAQVPVILEVVLRYQIEERADTRNEPPETLCIAVRHDGRTSDPDADVMRRLGRPAQALSACEGATGLTVIAGPVEWLRDDEVRVKGAYRRGTQGETPLAYRVVREEGQWVCAGPILSWDPL